MKKVLLYNLESNYIKNLDINYQMELEKSMINCIYNQKKKIEQLEEIISILHIMLEMETDSNSIRENKIKLLTNELTLLKGSIKTSINYK